MKGPFIGSFKSMIVGLSCLALSGQQAPLLPPAGNANPAADIYTSRSKDLAGHPFQVGNWVINLDISTPLIGKGGRVTLRVQNASNTFQEFNPANLILVNSSGLQIQLREAQLGESTSFLPTRIAPQAFIIRNLSAANTESLSPTLRVYFGDSLLAKITD
ncbi:MAG: hypothetical protein HXX12_00800 [Geothrix sp.]|uniref:hypothetical protein n=1 Tax=Geothrix sp. TaxID=1962974 RepID=UPI001803210C|nr:hypothetical protein [Geothrix sp.]NWJ39494.1 hypothetical protein [Geothrix sp.]WIL19283.1 MAG: hypothetical protein QOZ81_001793 [Geothrix sp.]